jgi:hypothetical protein
MLPKKSFLNQENNFSKMPESSDSRTLHLDKYYISRLTSYFEEERVNAIHELPIAMTDEEIDDLGLHFKFTAINEGMSDGSKLARSSVSDIGKTALLINGDLVTAESSRKYLKRQGPGGIVASLFLKNNIRRAKKKLIHKS